MGGHWWFYIVPYQPDIARALLELREREFKAGRYNPVVRFPMSPVDRGSPSPGAQHSSIEQALVATGETGTRSILDISRIAPHPDFFVAAPLSESRLQELYGTAQPTREMAETDMEFSEDMERGQGVYVVLYKDGKPTEILFAGYSFD
jgi:hypothetical protein